MARVYRYTRTIPAAEWLSYGPATNHALLRAAATGATHGTGIPRPPRTAPITVEYTRHDGTGHVPCDETDADTITLTLTWGPR